MYFDALRQRQREFWLRADQALNLLLLVLSLIPMSLQVQRAVGPVWLDPVLLGMVLIALLAAGDSISLSRRQRRWAPAAVLPVLVLAVILVGVWHVDPTTHLWLVAALVLPFTRFDWHQALALGSAAVGMSVWILHYKWQADVAMLMRSGLSGCLSMAVLAIFFRAWEAGRAQIADATNMLENTLENITQGVMVFNSKGRLQLFNSPALQQLGLPAEFLLREPALSDIVRYQYQRGDFGAAFERVDERGRDYVAAAGGSSAHLLRNADKDYSRRSPDGRQLQIVTRAMPDGSYVRTFADVTAYQRAMEQAQQASLAKSRFLANMSHELRTPLSAMLGLLQLMRETALTPSQQDDLDKIERSGDALLGLINDVLDLSKIEAGKMELLPEPFSLDLLLQDLGVIASGYLGHKPIELRYRVDRHVPDELVGDAMRLRQVLINLMGNAIKFTSRGHVVLRIDAVGSRATTGAVVQRLRFAVTDSGIGLSSEQRSHIFEGFAQAESGTARRYGGTGLGLTISQRIIELMGGQLAVESVAGQGSTFFFELDLQRVPGAAPQPTVDVAAGLAGLRIRLVDADADRADDLRELLWAAGLGAGDGAVTPVNASAVPIDLLIEHESPHDVTPAVDDGPLRIVLAAGSRPSDAAAPAHPRVMRLVKPVTAGQLRQAALALRQSAVIADSSPSAAASVQPVSAPSTVPPPRNRLSGLRVLVAEDHPINREVALKLLMREGARVTLAENGRQAVEALAQAPTAFDFVLMDMQMPELDGLEATRLIRNQLRLHHLPVLAMTANVMSAEREACLAAGMDAHLGKPLRVPQLIETLARLNPALLDAVHCVDAGADPASLRHNEPAT